MARKIIRFIVQLYQLSIYYLTRVEINSILRPYKRELESQFGLIDAQCKELEGMIAYFLTEKGLKNSFTGILSSNQQTRFESLIHYDSTMKNIKANLYLYDDIRKSLSGKIASLNELMERNEKRYLGYKF